MGVDLTARLGPVTLRTPLIAASGTVGSVVDAAGTIDFRPYGAAVAKSVSAEPWPGRPAPRLAPAGTGMVNAVGIQNPGIDAWARIVGPGLAGVGVPVWGSAVGHTPEEFALVARGLASAGVSAVEINLSCPNLEDGTLWALEPRASARVVGAVRAATDLPLGVKLSPEATDVVAVAAACLEAGADWLVLTNTVRGTVVDPATGRSRLAAPAGGYSGPPLKPIALRCVTEVHRAIPEAPIVGVGGVTGAVDVLEYLRAGASAVGLGTVHFAQPRAARRILRDLIRLLTGGPR